MNQVDLYIPNWGETRRLFDASSGDLGQLRDTIRNAAQFLHRGKGRPFTPLSLSHALSEKTGANVYYKGEHQWSRTGAYKDRWATFALREMSQGTTASAGNHAQGFALACDQNGVEGRIFMPIITPNFKVDRTARFGWKNVTIELIGDNFDEAAEAMKRHARDHGVPIVHPFDDWDVIAGQWTIALELLQQMNGEPIDYLIVPIWGGGISAGMATWFALHSPRTQIIAVEPVWADAMKKSLEQWKIITLEKIDTFADGAAVKTPGQKNFQTLQSLPNVHYMTVSSGAISATMCRLHDDEKQVVEPAWALSVTALSQLESAGYPLRGKNVICVITGGNIGMERWPDIVSRAYEYEWKEKEFEIAVKNTPWELLRILETYVEGNQITLLRFNQGEWSEVSFTLRLRNTRQPQKIVEFEQKIKADGLLWWNKPRDFTVVNQGGFPFRRHFTLKLPNRPWALLEALRSQWNGINIVGFDYCNKGFVEATCSVTVASKTETEIDTFITTLQKGWFY